MKSSALPISRFSYYYRCSLKSFSLCLHFFTHATLELKAFLLLTYHFYNFFLYVLENRLSNEISSIIMRRHTLDPDNIKRQIKSVFTSPTRKFRNFKNHNHNNNNNSNDHSIGNSGRNTRRFSVPEKQYSDRLDVNPELHTIHEVSQLISIKKSAFSCLLCCSTCMFLILHSSY
jgi:hypothetical protein